ncbi:PREDICTED: histidine--tRNA ligase, cytoplasmic [Tarenaya hassleriana]|uniref:histidine--tRNA ligase, cytoplasmic n=1 Tax=Tarenaya hassleriana TaxID=28532 RepID=UPI00053C5A97|nr:PREDICTED: histidine--tRNA ligase, cytoplasmic [Tarenaya hassleriana]
MAAERSSITLGGKGSSLSSSSVYKVASAVSQVRIDSSAFDRLSSAKPQPTKSTSFAFPQALTIEEFRASLVVLLNKLLLSTSLSSIRTVLPVSLSDSLNSKAGTLNFGGIDVTDGECTVLENAFAPLIGICSVVDHKSAALSQIVDAVAALSCEATKSDVSSFSSLDSGDGYGDKEAIAVAGDLKVLLNGSKFAGKRENGAISKIPRIHGRFRDMVKQVHAVARIELNSGVKGGKSGGSGDSGTGEALGTALSALSVAIKNLGECCLLRSKLVFESIENEALRNDLMGLFQKSGLDCSMLKDAHKLAYSALFEEDYCKFAHQVNELLGIVWKLVSWEAVAAFFALEGGELVSQKGADANGEDSKTTKKSDKKKKNEKKAVLGKGTSVIVQFIKERLLNKETIGDQVESWKIWVEQILLLLNPEDHSFDSFLEKVKEIVESNESRRLPKLPKGTRDFAKEQMTVRERAFSIIQEVFKRHGATALDTPVFELRETLMGKYGEDSKLIYDLADQGGELCSLRYDLTVPFARYVAMNGLTSFKRYQIAKVYRRDNPSKGRYREFYQCDLDIAGQFERMGPDFEIVKILTELLDELNIGDYEVKLNHRRLLDGMLEICGVPSEKFRTICSSIDKLDKQSFEQVKKEMVEEKGLSTETADRIGGFVKERGRPIELLTKLKQEGSEFMANKSSTEALEDLSILFEALERSNCSDKVVFDLSLARGLDYYTGVIFEAVFKGGVQVGSIGAGGRYDNLIGMFGTRQVPAVGMSLGIERVFNIMEELHKQQNQIIRPTETQALVSIMVENKLSEAAELVSQLWAAKIKAEYLVTKRRAKHFDRAKESRIPWMVIVGDRELTEGVVTLKNMESGNEEEVPRSSFVQELSKRLNP